MSKPKKPIKVLVRHGSAPVRSCKSQEKRKTKFKKVHFVEDVQPDEQIQPKCLCAPEFSTILQLANEVNELRCSQASSCDLKEAYGKHSSLDFLPEEKIFHDLVDLNVPQDALMKVKSQQSLKSVSKRDPELNFTNYLKYTLEPEYFFPAYSAPAVSKAKNIYDGRSIYKKLQVWKANSGLVFK